MKNFRLRHHLCHVVTSLKDGGEEIMVFKWWSRRFQCWEYGAERLDTIKMLKIPIKKKKSEQLFGITK